MAEYIERQVAIDLFYPVDPENDGLDGCTVVYKTGNYSSEEIEAMISDLSAADVAPVRHGRWVWDTKGLYPKPLCSRCQYEPYRASNHKSDLPKYCPNCGAIMDLEG